MTSLPSITVRMTEKDVARLKAISADMGIPYSVALAFDDIRNLYL